MSHHSNAKLRYIQIATYLRNYIQQNMLDKGSQIPTEVQLCKQFKCSRTTVRLAVDLLVEQGQVKRVQGAGTFVAQQIVSDNIRTLAVIVPNVTNSEIARIVGVLGLAAIDRGSVLVFGLTNDNPQVERSFIDEVARQKVSGVVKFPTAIECESEMRKRMKDYGLPYVVVNDFWTDCHDDHHVAYDEHAAVAMAIDHLVSLGHERIIFVDEQRWPRKQAIEVFKRELKQRDLPCGDDQIFQYDLLADLPDIGNLFEGNKQPPTAMVAAYAFIAHQLLVQLHNYDLRVPEDVSVISINGGVLEPTLGLEMTATTPPNQRIVDQVLKILADGPADGQVQHCLFRPSLHMGNSTSYTKAAATTA